MLSRLGRWMIVPVLLLLCSMYMFGLRIWQGRAENWKTKAEYSANAEAEKNEEPEMERLNLNTATKEDLMKLDGIGEKTAERILEKREQIGEFKVIEQLTEIKGIGEKTFDEIKDLITVE